MIADQLILNKKTTKEQYEIDRRSERPLRSIAKSISWRLIGTLDTILISWIITGKVKVALSIGLVELFTKMLLYFFHERIWNQIGWGK
jgi:uncharacterized membrane protein